MDSYKFTTDEFAVSETGIHLLRNRYNFETILFKDITFLVIKKGMLLSNWIFVLLIGAGLIFFSMYYAIAMVNVFNDRNVHQIHIEEIAVPALPLLLGGYCIYLAVQSGIIMTIQMNGKKRTFALTKIVKGNKLLAFVEDLKGNSTLGSKLLIHYE